MIRTIPVKSSSRTEMIDITASVQEAVRQSGVREGVCVVFVPHTTAAVTLNENADPSVLQDLNRAMNQLVPFENRYLHLEGNSAAHIKSSLLGCSHSILIESGQLVLGTWQGVFFWEFDGPRNRKVYVRAIRDRE
jgi:secondary thiamine-phosphate synthase enzyme